MSSPGLHTRPLLALPPAPCFSPRATGVTGNFWSPPAGACPPRSRWVHPQRHQRQTGKLRPRGELPNSLGTAGSPRAWLRQCPCPKHLSRCGFGSLPKPSAPGEQGAHWRHHQGSEGTTGSEGGDGLGCSLRAWAGAGGPAGGWPAQGQKEASLGTPAMGGRGRGQGSVCLSLSAGMVMLLTQPFQLLTRGGRVPRPTRHQGTQLPATLSPEPQGSASSLSPTGDRRSLRL